MTEAEETSADEATTKTVIKPNTDNKVKGKKGLHTDDFVGNQMSGLSAEQVRTVTLAVLDVDSTETIDPAKYDHLNAGQQKMAWSNKLRFALKRKPEREQEVRDAVAAIRAEIAAEAEEAADEEEAA